MDTELALATFPEQLGDPSGESCEFEWKHVCMGHARAYYNTTGGAQSKYRASLVRKIPQKPSAEIAALTNLSLFLQHVMSKPPCTLTFLGDSISNDNFAAAVAGAHALGFRRKNLCLGAGGALYLENDNSTLHRACGGSMMRAEFVPPKTKKFKFNPRCSSLSFMYGTLVTGVQHQGWCNGSRATFAGSGCIAMERALAESSYIVLNSGVHGNTVQQYYKLLVKFVRPLLKIHLSNWSKILWRETLPQHFPNNDGSGLFSSKYPQCEFYDCVPVTNRSRANWRNRYFEKWLAAEASPEHLRDLRVIRVFDVFLERHDLHLNRCDCTHFLYSPFTWQHVWASIVTELSILSSPAPR